MNDREALLAVILANPADDIVRGAYADCLDETGDETDAKRAEFIRCQLIAHGPTATHPNAEWCDCQPCRCARRANMIWESAPHVYTCGGYIRPVADYKRGFLWRYTAVSIENAVAELPDVILVEPIETVFVANHGPSRVSIEPNQSHWTYYIGDSLLSSRRHITNAIWHQMRSNHFASALDARTELSAALLRWARNEVANRKTKVVA